MYARKNSWVFINLCKADNVSDGWRVFGDNEYHDDGAATAKLRWLYVLLEDQLSRHGRQIGSDDDCQDSRFEWASFRDTTVHFDVGTWRRTDIPCILCAVGLAASAVRPVLQA